MGTFTEQLESLLGESGWLNTESAAKYTTDWLKLTQSQPLGVARPATVEVLCSLVQLCQENAVQIVPQGGNTGLVLGSVPTPAERSCIIVSIERMNAIEHIDTIGCTVTVQAGAVLEQLQCAIGDAGLTLPLHLGSGGSAQIGGLISTNAGGYHAHRDGMMGDRVLGLDVVLPNGQIWSGNRALIKDNAGYDLKRLFCGAEGTLGIVTRATLRLEPLPTSTETLLLACNSLADALNVLRCAQSLAGPLLSAAEFMHSAGISLLQQQCPQVNNPLDTIPPYALLIEFTSSSDMLNLQPIVERLLEQSLEKQWAIDGVVAGNESQRKALWQLREEIPEGQRLHGPQLKHDVSVPVASLPEFIDVATKACHSVMNSVLVNPFGHLADGNVHFNLSAPIDAPDEFVALKQEFNTAVYDAVVGFNGSIAAEHGLGRNKVSLADQTRSQTERLLMKKIKQAIDPNSIMNRGVIVAPSDEDPIKG